MSAYSPLADVLPRLWGELPTSRYREYLNTIAGAVEATIQVDLA